MVNGGLGPAESAQDSSTAFLQDSGPQGITSIETEHYHGNTQQGTHQWVSDSTGGASNSAAMITSPNNGALINTSYSVTSPRLDFDIEFVKTGTHYVWLRGIGDSDTGSTDDSLHAGLNGVEGSTSDRITGFNSNWTWTRSTMDGPSATINVPTPGIHTVNLWMREDGLIIDILVLTTNSGYDPSSINGGLGPAESVIIPILPQSDDFNNGNAIGWTIIDNSSNSSPSAWTVVGGELHQLNQVARPSINGGFDGTYHFGTYAYLDASTILDNYRFSVDVTPQTIPGFDTAHDVGVLFRYTDNNNFYRLSINSVNGFTRLEKRFNGVFSPLATNSRGYTVEQLLHIDIEVEGSIIQIWLNGDPLFAVYDPDLPSGGIGLYCQNKTKFDNVSVQVNDPSPAVVIGKPLSHTVDASNILNVTAIARNIPAGGSVDVELDSLSSSSATWRRFFVDLLVCGPGCPYS